MNSRILFATFTILLTMIQSLKAQEPIDPPWDPSDPEAWTMPPSSLEGEIKMLVIAASCPEDIANGWITLEMPTWLTDSFIASTQALINNNQCKWSMSNFWYAASHGVFKVVGDVNPGNNGNFFVSDQTLDNYTREEYMEHILTKADQVIDFSDYDGDGDGHVDYAIMIYPRTPNVKYQNWPEGKSCWGVSSFGGYMFLDGVWVDRGHRCGCTIDSFQDTLGNWYDVPNFALNPHVALNIHEEGHTILGLYDWYDLGDNMYARSYPLGWYSVMQNAGQPHTAMFCAAELAEKAPASWTNVIEVDENSQNNQLFDMLSPNGQILKIPVACREAFYVSAHMQNSSYSHWEELMGGLEIVGTDTTPRASTGVLIWHVCERFDYTSGSDCSELALKYDLECAEGKWDLEGFQGYYPDSNPVNPDNPRPELGWDRLNLCTAWGYHDWPDPSYGYGEPTNPNDFWKSGYK